jgi:hypothetical protein
LTAKPPFRRLARVLALALSLGAIAAALTGASQTLAQTHRPTCSTAGAHAAKVKSHAGACATHKGKPDHADKRRGKHAHARTKGKGGSRGSHHPATARCEDGSAPTPADEGSFACADGSEPECEDGATPTPASNGKSLVCPPSSEREAGASEAECEEDEEEETSCTGEPSPQACEAADPQCKTEG